MDLHGHAALITGGTRGVGAAIARSLAKSGANLIIHGLIDDQDAQETLSDCRDFGVQAELVCCNLANEPQKTSKELAFKARSILPSIDMLVNNAGTYMDLPFLEMTWEVFEKTFHLNVASGYFLAQAFAKNWIAEGIRGRILFTGSINGLLAEEQHTAYDASKGAVAALVRSLCVTLAPHGIRVNAIAPGLVRTPLTNQVLSRDTAALAWMKLHTPNQSVPGPEVCGGAAVFLLSDVAEHIQGQTLYIDGGMSAWQQPDLPGTLRDAVLNWHSQR